MSPHVSYFQKSGQSTSKEYAYGLQFPLLTVWDFKQVSSDRRRLAQRHHVGDQPPHLPPPSLLPHSSKINIIISLDTPVHVIRSVPGVKSQEFSAVAQFLAIKTRLLSSPLSTSSKNSIQKTATVW